jgi:hypothetical protein
MIEATIEGYIFRGDLARYGSADDVTGTNFVGFDEYDLETLGRDLMFNEDNAKETAARLGIAGTDADLMGVTVIVVINEERQ